MTRFEAFTDTHSHDPLYRKILHDLTFLKVVAVLFVLAALLIGANVVLGIYGQDSELGLFVFQIIDLQSEESLGEAYQQGLELTCALTFLTLYFVNTRKVFLAFALLFAFVWFDDTITYHEFIGKILVERFSLGAFGDLRPQDTGELLAWILAAMVLSLAFIWAWLSRREGDAAIGWLLAVPFFILVFFGVVVDMFHVVAPADIYFALGVIEDGGELLAISVTAALAVTLMRDARDL
ncbi:hypothetical protein ILP92_00050 [Maribius pontilimi]|uniref:Uncharacterized protein n=1 Tax=Palleronia pontilimi TaxID=1964209 RepID=A0A934IEA8_9RHOB|nr:hypothetical protein [Palleronia pontilimi]MBJ3761141.1 hypothetical protein [Palleronia pontilimi]